MRVLILGGAGFIGSHLAERLRADGHDVVTADLHGADVEADLSCEDDWRQFTWAPHMRRHDPFDHVYMLAAVVGVGVVERDPHRALDVNTKTVLRLLDWLPESSRLFFASTSEVYAGSVIAGIAPVPTPEQVPLSVPDLGNPRFAYATSKILGEAAITYAGRNAVIGRFHNVYGPRMGRDHAIPALTRRLASTETPCRIYGAEQTRAFCHVSDAVEAMIRVMQVHHSPDLHDGVKKPLVVNIGNDTEEVTIEHLAGEIADVLDLDSVMIERVAAPPGSVARRCPDLTRLRTLTGFAPSVKLRDGLEETVAWALA